MTVQSRNFPVCMVYLARLPGPLSIARIPRLGKTGAQRRRVGVFLGGLVLCRRVPGGRRVAPGLEQVARGPRLAVVVGEGRVDAEDARVAVLAGRRDHVVPPYVARRPGHVPHEAPMPVYLGREVELLLRLGDPVRSRDDVARPVDLDGVHAGDHDAQGVCAHAGPQRRVARLRVRVEAHLEGDLLAAIRLAAYAELVDGRVLGQVLGLVVLVDGEAAVGRQEREIRVPRLLVVLHAERAVGRARRARVKGWPPADGAACAEAAAWRG